MAQSFYLREQAERCRRLARSTGDADTQERFFRLAAEYDMQADVQDGRGQQVHQARRDGQDG